ncbi:MAG: class I SAM-dependent methyltransferase [Gammaproteobacteria bacterium]|jgi:ubiquinone/menaquinone biosynthesis C-methylase UbiE|nr:class I SAM-dependent methyltransferase [Gammaproteobacteria bacterium]
MAMWADRVLPRIIDRGMRNAFMDDHRYRAAPLASGRVLEIGAGSGLNFPHYSAAVSHLFALEPSAYLREKAGEVAAAAPFPVDMLNASAESIPLETHAVDTVVSSWTMCSIPDLETSLQEVRRVLKPGGRLVFIEHGRSPEAHVSRWQDRLAPLSARVLGCSLNRPVGELVTAAGFELLQLESGYFDGPKLLAYHFVGQAQPR